MRTRLTERLGIALPILQAPMAGVSTPAMAAAVSNAGGLGAVALGAGTADQARQAMAAVRAATNRPFGVNLFTHAPAVRDVAREAGWLDRLQPVFAEFGVEPPQSLTELYRSFNEDDAMLAAVVEARPPVVSCHFGLPAPNRVAAIKAYGGFLLVSATTVAEARTAEAAGADAVVAQGYEAGGHRGTHGLDDEAIGSFALVPQIAAAVSVPVVCAGGVADGRGIVAALALGAEAVQIGTAYVACPESAAAAPYRALLADAARSARTGVTAAISGRPARSIRTRFVDELGPHEAAAPAYPVAYDAGKALAAAAGANGSPEFAAVWAGQHVIPDRTLPAAELTRHLMADAAAVLSRLASHVVHGPVTWADAESWLARYGIAWEGGDVDLLVSLFTQDARYIEKPFDPPLDGRDAIATYWGEGARDTQRDVSFTADVWSVVDGVVLAGWAAQFVRLPSGVQVSLDGVFRLRLQRDPGGAVLCSELREWWYKQEGG